MKDIVMLFVALLTITNPAGALSLFTGMTGGISNAEKRKIAVKTSFAVLVILLAATWLGSHLLGAFGVGTAGLEAAGGIIIGLMGISMLHDKTSHIAHSTDEANAVLEKPNIAVVPMALPIIAGPGAISTIIITTHKLPSLMEKIYISIACAGVCFVVLLSLYFAGPIGKMLGKSGISVLTKIMGMVLLAIAVQMAANGIKMLLAT